MLLVTVTRLVVKTENIKLPRKKATKFLIENKKRKRGMMERLFCYADRSFCKGPVVGIGSLEGGDDCIFSWYWGFPKQFVHA
jgi:hypothetical protein